MTAVFSGPDRFAIHAGRAFGDQPMPAGALSLCADGKFVGIQRAAAPAPNGWPVADYPDGAMLPGLTDCHVHLCRDSGTGALDRLPHLDASSATRSVPSRCRSMCCRTWRASSSP